MVGRVVWRRYSRGGLGGEKGQGTKGWGCLEGDKLFFCLFGAVSKSNLQQLAKVNHQLLIFEEGDVGFAKVVNRGCSPKTPLHNWA